MVVGIIWHGLRRGSGDSVGRGFGGVEVGRGKVVRGELGHGLIAWILTRWATDSR